MPDSIQNAYLILLGQIVLVATSAIFGIPYFLSSHDLQDKMSGSTIYYLIFIFISCAIMIMNIIIGWTATQEASKNSKNYNNKMFIIDLIIIICFFSMNNIITFSFGDTLSVKNVKTMTNIINSGVELNVIALTSSILYIITAVFLYMCKLWNYEYYRISNTRDTDRYEKVLSISIMVMIVTSIATLVFRNNPYIISLSFVVWVYSWVYVNIDWIKSNFLYE